MRRGRLAGAGTQTRGRRQRARAALRALLAATALALASEGAAEAGRPLRADHDARGGGLASGGSEGPEVEELLASHAALHRAAVAHAMHRKREESLSDGRPIDLPVIPKSPPVCSAPVRRRRGAPCAGARAPAGRALARPRNRARPRLCDACSPSTMPAAH